MRLHRFRFAACLLLPACFGPALLAQPPLKPFQAQSTSSISLSGGNNESAVEIVNVTYEVVGGIPGRPAEELDVLRKTIRSREVLGDIGVEASTTVEAWPLGADLKQKPRYSLTVSGTECESLDNALLVISRGLEETEWWSVYAMGTGAHMFDTYVPLVRFSIASETDTLRYLGIEVPPDDVPDRRLKEPHVVAVVTYASADRVIREAIITAEDPRQAAQLRSLADETREISVDGRGPARVLRIVFSQNYPSPPASVTLTIPIAHDDLDLTHAATPARIHVTAWKR